MRVLEPAMQQRSYLLTDKDAGGATSAKEGAKAGFPPASCHEIPGITGQRHNPLFPEPPRKANKFYHSKLPQRPASGNLAKDDAPPPKSQRRAQIRLTQTAHFNKKTPHASLRH